MKAQSLTKKLRIKEFQSILIVNPPKGYLKLLGAAAKDADSKPAKDKEYDFAQMFVNDKKEYDKLSGDVLAAVTDDAMVWICYPKKSAGKNKELSRDVLVLYPQSVGFRGVSIITIDDIWAGMRFRRAGHVGKVRASS